jgi:hypothetical protein
MAKRIIMRSVVKRKPWHMYYVDGAGNIGETPMAKRAKSAAPKKKAAKKKASKKK